MLRLEALWAMIWDGAIANSTNSPAIDAQTARCTPRVLFCIGSLLARKVLLDEGQTAVKLGRAIATIVISVAIRLTVSSLIIGKPAKFTHRAPAEVTSKYSEEAGPFPEPTAGRPHINLWRDTV